jgi:hypothetical protein
VNTSEAQISLDNLLKITSALITRLGGEVFLSKAEWDSVPGELKGKMVDDGKTLMLYIDFPIEEGSWELIPETPEDVVE